VDRTDGGCLMTFADFSLLAFASKELGTAPAVTVSFDAEFIEAGREGDLIEAEGDVVRAGRTLVFFGACCARWTCADGSFDTTCAKSFTLGRLSG
jgi:acyl-coenzyme A thioesterase PaaI-like protein